MGKKLILLILCSAILWGCAREQFEEIGPEPLLVDMHLSASITQSKVVLNDALVSPLWESGDKLAVYDGSAVREFVLVSGEGTKSAVFSGQVSSSATSLEAVYPYSAATLKGNALKYTIPDSQSVTAPGADPEALVMTAKSAPGSTLHFSNCTSLLTFTVPASVRNLVLVLDDYLINMDLPGVEGRYAMAVQPGIYSSVTAIISTAEASFIKESSNPLMIDEGFSMSLGALSLDNPVITIRTADELSAFLSSASSADKSRVLIVNDIDMTGTPYSTASGFGGTLNGYNHTVNIGNASAPLFDTLDGSISSLVLDGGIASSSTVAAALVITNNGSISSVKNKADVKLSSSAAVSDPIVIGGITAYNYGSLVNCSNEGEVSFTGSSSITGAAIGGIAGYSEGPLKFGSNSGKVSLSAKWGSGMCALGKIAKSASNLGGIVGAGWEGFSLTSCNNSGEVSFLNDAIGNATEIYQRSQIGGIVGSPYGEVNSCKNTGPVSVVAVTASREALSTVNYILDIGGISGGSFHETANYQALNDHSSIISCTNQGSITVDLDASASNSPIGGIVGWPNGEKTGIACKTSACTNSGNITVSGAGKVRAGGIMGGTGFPENCNNSGRIYIKSANSGSAAGGIAAFHSQDHGLYGCVNTGDVVSDVTLLGIGGLIGCHGEVNLTSSLACKVLCDVISAAPDRGGVGMVIGTYNNVSKTVVLGSPEEPIEVKGSVKAGGVEVELNINNFSAYLAGTSKTSSTHIIYAFCNTPGPETYAEGKVLYSDGTPASGVSVSDGFSVAVTDAAGSYHITTCPDSYYIYISLPADAVINKNSNGCPNFYIRYTGSASNYNFTLQRQAVETEFLLFAMADPQAHNSNRGTGKADTNRFRDEALPAINAHIAEQTLPCYGVTLGDIVYSEGSRNSNGGMTTMRTHFKNLNMPVFQTMGNHDYTYFYSNSPLAVDSESSTLYLRAQRKFEEVFGPVNLSFNRGNVHVVCMRNIIYDSNTDASSYHCGYTDEQWAWLQADLANVPKTNMVILCGHIPLVGRTGNEHVSQILSLLRQFKAYKVFSGHTHYKRYATVSGVAEHIHAAVCGTWWWSNVEGDGTPNGYTVYRFNGTSVTDEYSMGMNTHMNTRDYQMRVYRGNLTNGGSIAKFQWPHESTRLMINVFNGDSRWTVKVYENNALVGNGRATLMSYNRQTWDKITTGTTYTVSTSSSQDWWAIGYLIGVRGKGTSNTSYYTSMYHMFTYVVSDPTASLRVEATDAYGNTYTCTEIIDTDSYYPNYMKFGNAN